MIINIQTAINDIIERKKTLIERLHNQSYGILFDTDIFYVWRKYYKLIGGVQVCHL